MILRRMALAIATVIAVGQSAPTRAADFQMERLDSPPSNSTNLEIIGGEEEVASRWPATFVFKNKKGEGCTATAVGSWAVLTAAHCIENNASGTVTISGAIVALTCKHHPEYDPDKNPSADFALCRTKQEMSGFPFEVINTDPSRPQVEQTVRLLGYGCLKKNGTDHSFGVLYGGDSTVNEVPKFGHYTVTIGGAAVCFGDSGGGSFLELSTAGRRVLFGVNSRGNIKDRSRLSTTATDDFLAWAEDWATLNDAAICGITPKAKGCLGA